MARQTQAKSKVTLADLSGENLVSAEQLLCIESAVLAAMSYFRLVDMHVDIALIDEMRMRDLNRTYRQIDRSTDVLSFAARESETIVSRSRYEFLGDIAICPSVARRQAVEYGHDLRRELAFLTIHGVLHLLGYDHTNGQEEAEMFAIQDKVLVEMGLLRPRGSWK